ncbi:MAG: PilW family protein [Algiphilus sp.]|uniref:PilW family protein n=1 Tax=Algiphilus sp. TaxID=1872431 RepID=UPI0032F05F45
MTVRARRHQQGISLVELMISVALGLVILAGVDTVFVTSRHSYRVQESTAILQDNARFAMETIGRALRDAGFTHGAPLTAMQWIPSSLDDSDAAACSAGWYADLRRPIEIHNGAGATPLSGCTVSNYEAQTDVLVIRHADPLSAPGTGYLPRTEIEDLDGDTLLLRAIPATRGVIYQRGAATTVDSQFTDDDEDDGVFDYRFRARVFHVGVPSGATAAEGPALYEHSPDFGNPDSQPIVSGVERFTLVAGMDRNGDGIVESWDNPEDVAAADFVDISAIRVGLILRAPERSEFADNTTYTLPDGDTYTPPDALERFPRRLYVQDFQIRNHGRGG